MDNLKAYLKQKQIKYKTRYFKISAISIPITYNKYGDFDPNGLMYVLKKNESLVKNFVRNNPNQTHELISPLVIRVNVGDLISIKFENRTSKPASMHVQGVLYDVSNSDGSFAGYNQNSLTDPYCKKTYTWYAQREGTFLINDMGDVFSGNQNTNLHGLFGVLIVEAFGATWTDPITSEELKSGCYADIHHPFKPDFREYVTIFHDESEVYDKDGNTPINHETGEEDMTMSINYRSEPMRHRMPFSEDLCGEEVSMSSWVYGDPSTPVLRAYVGDPAKFRIVHAGIMETHIFHLHNHQWPLECDDPKSTLIDSISFSPQQCLDMEPIYGAGSLNGCIGDVIWHCHLYPHFMMGMWGLWRIMDRLEDGTRVLPSGELSPKLYPLPDRVSLLPTDLEHPGYPNFLKGEFQKKASKPPLSIIGKEARLPTELETKNMVADAKPGSLFAKAIPEGAPVKVFEIYAIQLPISYNKYGWHDPEGRVFVLKEDKDAVLSGEKEVEPLVIRVNAGDGIEIHFTNELPLTIGGNAFQLVTKTSEAGWHIHLVKFDTIVADGSANGWCLDASAVPGDTIIERFYADVELRTVFFHDHLFPNAHQQHGLFGALIVEPQGATYHDDCTGDELKSGTKAIIKPLVGNHYREFVLFVHDFALLYDKDNMPLNPPEMPSSHEDPGVMGINYRCEPLHYRDGDPAYAFSSFKHGDPATPLLETYEGDPIRIRLLDGAHEEQHAFNLNGLRWRKEPTDPTSPYVNAQTYGISEAFNLEIYEDYKKGDYLYYYGGMDDLWLGLWGIIRAHGEKVPHLQRLADRPIEKHINLKKPVCTRKFDIVAMQKDLVYNEYGDHDANGLLFALASDEKMIQDNIIKPKPLILRANAGDLIELTLTNHLFDPVKEEHHPEVPLGHPYPASNRVSMHCQLLKYDPLCSDGATVGYNPDQTIGVGESITYKWYADEELGACLLTNFADIKNHRHRGLFGALIIEPCGAKYLDQASGEVNSFLVDEQIIVSSPGEESYREFVLFMQDGVALHDGHNHHIHDGSIQIVPDDDPHAMEIDCEDQGQKAFNYKSERLANRFKDCPEIHNILSSYLHHDPVTPLFKAYPNDKVIIRLLMPADKPRNHSFILHGHSWKQQWQDPFSDIVSVQGALSVGNVVNIVLEGGANVFAGDFVYRSGLLRWDIEQGMWGIFRIYDRLQRNLAVINGNVPENDDCECN